MEKSVFILGVDIGGTYTKCGIIDIKNKALLAKTTFNTVTSNLADFVQALFEQANGLCRQLKINIDDLRGTGIGIPGYVNEDMISMVWPFLCFLEGRNFSKMVSEQFKTPLKMDNDARVVALGEAHFADNLRSKRLLSITLGTGVGASLVVQGKLQDDCPINHMAGHIAIRHGSRPCYCGISGCLETLISADTIVEKYKTCINRNQVENEVNNNLEAKNIYEFARIGDIYAKMIIKRVLEDLAAGLNSYIYLYAPDKIVLGGGQSEGLNYYLPELKEALVAKPFEDYKVQLEVSKLAIQAGVLGAAFLLLT